MTTRSMISPRLAEPALRVLSSLCAGTLVLLAAPSAFAQGKLDARYEATLAGIPVGKGAWTIDISDDTFSAAASGGTSGLLKAFAGGSGTGGAQGRVVNGALVATSYSATTTTSKKSEAIRMVLSGGNVKEYVIEPEPPVEPERLPVTDAQRRDIAKSSFVPGLESLGGSNSRPFQEPRTYRGRAASRQGSRRDFAPAPPPGKTGLARSSIGLSRHISGAIAAEIILPRMLPRGSCGFV